MKTKDQATLAARTVLTQCLTLPSGAEVVIFADETTMGTVSILAEVAVSLHLKPTVLYFTRQMQIDLGKYGLFPGVESLLDDAVATLVCLNSTANCLPFRDQARQSALNADCKVAHMPGINQSTLLLADLDYEALAIDCELLALALAKGQHMEIITYDHTGNEYSLHVPLHSWRRLPIISDGIIQRGSWGNVPSGETYIAPPERLAEGSIVINGSIPGYAIPHGQEIFFSFNKGKLVDWTPHESPAAQHLLHTQIELAQLQGDENWNNLAEVGLGTNPRVKELTGVPLLDEKKYGSVHIALGDNIDMGGHTASHIHCDMVALFPKVLVDDKVIIQENKIVIREGEWREDYRLIQPTEIWQDNLRIACTAMETHIDDQGHLRRLWDTSSGRVCGVKVGNDETSYLAATLYQTVKRRGQPIVIADLAMQKPNLDLPDVLKLTYLLLQYELIKIH